jgi:uncharacterized protein (TIGR02246 family)
MLLMPRAGNPDTWVEYDGRSLRPLSAYLQAMRKRSALFWVLAVILAASAQAQPAQTTPEAAIRQLLAQQTAAWNRGDVVAFMQGYENSPDTTFVGDTVQYGYATILERYRKHYATAAAMGKLAFTHLAIRVLDANYAIATGNFHLDRNLAGGGNADGIFSLLFKKESSGWKIILDHSNRVG